MNECKLRCPNTIVVDHTSCYHGSKRGQAVTIERLLLDIPSHTGKEGNAHEAPAEREGLPGRMPMGVGFFEKVRFDSET
ncbi:hypothetical protein SO802_031303 [Lithocarpus litseifolius]|uniref:Uncharacterized protein n=1 Tax=Lithocarpus litseifolius TaxID=425828 RepID=A0AAW2BKL9_9ROSI